MGSEPEYEASSTPQLSLFSLPGKTPESPGIRTPPLRSTASVPFQWEEAPGKPRPCATEYKPKSARTLELPPRLLSHESKTTNVSSPTTVLEGPYFGRSLSASHSHRFALKSLEDHGRKVAKEKGGLFGSMRWGSFRKNKEVHQASFDFSSPVVDVGGYGDTKVKITRIRRRGSFLSVSNTKSNFLASIYAGFKQVVPWRRRQERPKKMGS